MLPPILPILVTASKSRVGKDFTANYLVRYFEASPIFEGYYVVCRKYKFATELKELTWNHFKTCGVKKPQVYEEYPRFRKTKLNGPLQASTVVDLWIKVGEFFRSLDPHVWVRYEAERVVQHASTFQAYKQATWDNRLPTSLPVLYVPVFSDWRMPEEYAYIAKCWGNEPVTIRVQADDGVAHKMDGELSEDAVDHVLVNPKTAEYTTVLHEWIQAQFAKSVQVLAQN